MPPYEDEEFRLHAERTIYGDMEDGGLMNGNPSFRTGVAAADARAGADESVAGVEHRAGKIRVLRTRRRPSAGDRAREMTANPRVFLVWPCQSARSRSPRPTATKATSSTK